MFGFHRRKHRSYTICYRTADGAGGTTKVLSTGAALARSEDLESDGGKVLRIIDEEGTEWCPHTLRVAADSTSFE
jgi:hypothetical protein